MAANTKQTFETLTLLLNKNPKDGCSAAFLASFASSFVQDMECGSLQDTGPCLCLPVKLTAHTTLRTGNTRMLVHSPDSAPPRSAWPRSQREQAQTAMYVCICKFSTNLHEHATSFTGQSHCFERPNSKEQKMSRFTP